MSKKTVRLKTKQQQAAAREAWVNNRVTVEEAETMKRLTIDVSASLHKRIKVQCAAQGLVMADVIRAMLEEKFPQS